MDSQCSLTNKSVKVTISEIVKTHMIHWEIICWSLYEAHGDVHCVNETFVVQRKKTKYFPLF